VIRVIFLDDIFGLFCHQLPERSPQIAGVVFPLCFRCAGLHLGLLASYAFLLASGSCKRRLPAPTLAIGTSFAILPLFLDGFANTLHLWSSPAWIRTLTGLGCGVALPLLVLPLAHRLTPCEASRLRPTLSHPAALIWPVGAGAALAWPLLDPFSVAELWILGVAALLGLLLFLGTVCLGVACSWDRVHAVCGRRRYSPWKRPGGRRIPVAASFASKRRLT